MEQQVQLQVDVVQERLNRLAAAIDNDVSSGKDARELHDFVQDEMLPVIATLAQDVRLLAEIVMEHDGAIADLGQNDADGTQILPEHAEELKAHLVECNTIIQQLVVNAKAGNVDATPFEQRIAVGEALIQFVDSVTLSSDDEEGEEDSGEEEE